MPKSVNSDAFRIHYNMLTSTGVWPTDNPTLYYKTKRALTWFFAMGLCATMWMEAMNDLNDFAKLSEILYIMVTITAYVIKLATFTYRKEEFLGIVNFLKDPVFMSYPEDVDHYMATTIKRLTLITNIYRYLVGCCVTLYLFFPMLDHTPLPFPFPYDMGKYNYLMYAFQMIGEGYAAWNNSTLDTLCTSLMGIGAAQLDILREKIIRLGQEDQAKTDAVEISNEKDEKVLVKLKQCVEHHVAIERFVESVDHVFTIGIFSQFITSALVICNTLFHFVLISVSLQFLLLANYFAVMFVELFVYCWYGNEIIFKSENLGEACYKFNWTGYGIKVRRHVFIMMERSKRPLYVTALKFQPLSLTAFVAVLRWSYSCLALLLKMYDKRSST